MENGFYVINTYSNFAPCIDINLENFNKHYNFASRVNLNNGSTHIEKIHASDKIISELLEIPYLDYIDLLISFGAYHNDFSGYVFKHEKNAKQFVDYLNDKYLLVLTLRGKVNG